MVSVVGNGHGYFEFKSWTPLFAFHMSLIVIQRYESKCSTFSY